MNAAADDLIVWENKEKEKKEKKKKKKEKRKRKRKEEKVNRSTFRQQTAIIKKTLEAFCQNQPTKTLQWG